MTRLKICVIENVPLLAASISLISLGISVAPMIGPLSGFIFGSGLGFLICAFLETPRAPHLFHKNKNG